MKKIISIIKLILQGSILYYFRNFFNSINNLKEIKKVNFSRIEEYFSKNRKKGKIEKNVLIELFFEHPSTNNNNYIINLLLSNKFSTKTIGFLKFNSSIDLKFVSSKHSIDKFAYIYTYKNIYYRIKSLYTLFFNLKNLKYDMHFGWHIYVDNIEVGDLIYDQFLRFKNLPTFRKLTFEYLVYIYNALFYYHRYKDVIKENNISDIILSHGVYAEFGMLVKAAASVNSDINIYQWFNLNPINISTHKANTISIRKPRVYEEYLMNQIINKYGKNKILEEYDFYLEKRLKAEDENQVDLKFVYKDNEINTNDEFYTQYSVKKSDTFIFIFAHAFVDSVKYEKWSLYSDYYTWLTETLKKLASTSKKVKIFIKPHPSESLYKCDVTVESVVQEINNKYNSEFIYLDKKIHNSIVFSLANVVITSNGTIGIEASCYGIPVLVAASTVYENSNITIQPKSLSEYENYLLNITTLKKNNISVINNAKLCFMFYTKYIFIDATFLRTGDYRGDTSRKIEYTLYNEMYGTSLPLDKEDLYSSFDNMITNNNFDVINLKL